ncbi:TerC family membrane protein [Listeria fleischmannii subsp. coloradonensis]|uniref:TerC family protein n=1 Tax=Listeria fleischmannii TaxID=1069827 RepID=UPI000254FA59|nr:TerC family protein [Listeria fleischmannii]EIA21251.1 TerC family membrane protein [Listeria fleischmannii subsp. coloradonensis]
MDTAMLLEYGWVLLVLIGLEGILAADNAVVMAVMVKHLPEKQQKKALFFGLMGAFVFRFAALFLISFLANVWQVQALGALYLLYIAISHIVKHIKGTDHNEKETKKSGSGFWMTVLKVEIADIAFAIDSMLAAVALAITLPKTGWGQIGGIDTGQFAVMFLGGLVGLIIIRFAATQFVKLLKNYPSLETAAFLIVGWVGVKLVVYTLAHESLGVIPHEFPESTTWKLIFWGVMILIIIWGWLISVKQKKKTQSNK